MRATAESTGRDPKIAEAMVDPSVYIEGIIDSGKVLTFTSSEALRYGFSNGTAESIAEALSLAGVRNYTIVKQQLTGLDRIINLLVSPAVSGILVLIILGGIYFELQTPGVGFPLLAAITAAVLYFAPLYLEGLAANWEILLFLIGLVLLAVELFVIPGFGVAGIAGIASILIGLVFSLIQNDGFDLELTGTTEVLTALATVLIPFTTVVVLLFLYGEKLLERGVFKRLVLQDVQSPAAGYVIADQHQLLGSKGIAKTTLRPTGKIEIAGTRYDARAESGYVEAGTEVEVVGQERFELIVRIC
jgi:membrane-bound serine protease (ClpP class)